MIVSEQVTTTVGEQFSRAYSLSLDATHESLSSALRSGARIARIQRDACDGLLHRLSDEGLLRAADEPAKTLYTNPWSGTELIKRGAQWLRICTEVAVGTQAELNAAFRDEMKTISDKLGPGVMKGLGDLPQASRQDVDKLSS